MKTKVSLKCFARDYLWKQLFASNSPQTPSNLTSLKMLVTLRPCTKFKPKIRTIKLLKSAKVCLTWQLLF